MSNDPQPQPSETPEPDGSPSARSSAAIVAPDAERRKRRIGSDEMKAEIAAYWRYTRQYPIIAVEYDGMDVAAARRQPRAFVETEVKVSMDDLRADGNKEKHFYYSGEGKDLERARAFLKGQWPTITYSDDRIVEMYTKRFKPNYFFFAVPIGMLEKALPVVQNLYPYAGLISVRPCPHLRGNGCVVRVRAKNLRTSEVTDARLWDLVESQSASLTRSLDRVVKAKEAYHERQG